MNRKWETEEEMNAELRRMAREMRHLKEELRGAGSRRQRYPKSQQALPTADERKLRSSATEDHDDKTPPDR